VAHAQIIKDIRVGSSQIGQRKLAKNQPLKHRLMDYAARHLFICAQWLKPCVGYRRRYEIVIHGVKIYD
jgi:hypothetical protein